MNPTEVLEPEDTDLILSPSHSRLPPLFSRLGEAVVQVAASAGELLADRDLRRKAGTLVVSQAGKRIKDLQEGVATRAGNLQRGLNEGPRQVQTLYMRIQRQYAVSRHEASLKAKRDMPVDVQVGPFLWEDAPQELRSRLWIALLSHPDLIGNLVEEKALEKRLLHSAEGNSPARCSHSGSLSPKSNHQPFARPSSAPPTVASKPEVSTEHPGSPLAEVNSESANLQGSPRPEQCSRTLEDQSRRQEDDQVTSGKPELSSSAGGSTLAHPEVAANSDTTDRENGSQMSSSQELLRASLHSPNCTEGRPPLSMQAELEHTEPSQDIAQNPEAQSEEGEEDAKSESGGQEEAWEIVQAGSSLNDFRGSQLASAQLQPGRRGSAMTLRERLLEAVCEVAWPISTVYPEGCRYDTLCQISVGQEDTEEIIQRDINRTFPEHPQFSFEQGQLELFRVLKAYSLHDLAVGYCQGMAFVTGVILMYVPEEPAFRLLTRLMDERGANLRLLYLPGLEGLKNYLRMFEWLMERMLPELREHLESFQVVPVLYASQWFLTAFSCPFPTAFSCRVIDVMLTENCGHVMLRVGMAVIRACAPALMELHDFEDLVTYLKVEPVKWSQQKARLVLNEAVDGTVSEDMLQAAAEAVTEGYAGSFLSRRPSSLKPETSAAAALRQPSLGTKLPSGPVSVASSFPAADSASSQAPGLRSREGEVASKEAEMNAEYQEILEAIALDNLLIEESNSPAP